MKQFELSSGAIVQKPTSKLWFVVGVLFVLVAIFSLFLFVKPPFFKPTELGIILKKMFTPSPYSTWGDYFGYSVHLVDPLIDTMSMAFGGTVIGSVMAIPVAILCAKNITKIKWVYQPVRFVLNFIRAIPVVFLAIFFVLLVGSGVLPGIIAITLFSFGIMAKMLYDVIETVDMNPYEALESVGATKTQALYKSVFPQVFPVYISYLIYIFEINVRASAIFGYFGAGGLGMVIADGVEGAEYDKVGITVLVMLLVVLIIQFLSNYTRGKLQ